MFNSYSFRACLIIYFYYSSIMLSGFYEMIRPFKNSDFDCLKSLSINYGVILLFGRSFYVIKGFLLHQHARAKLL